MIDSPSLQRRYYTAIELWLLKVVGPIYQIYPWKSLLKVGSDWCFHNDIWKAVNARNDESV